MSLWLAVRFFFGLGTVLGDLGEGKFIEEIVGVYRGIGVGRV